jgi:ubiquinone/menaquinone biosynthesis C-methylase UbiE
MTSENDARLHSEQAFFDSSVSDDGGHISQHYGDSLLSVLEEATERFLPDLTGKDLLFYGCGVNWVKMRTFAERGARVHAIDISDGSIRMMDTKVHEAGLEDRVFPRQMDCENLAYPDNSFDVVYGRAILHHLKLPAANREIRRVLRPGGVAVFIEPLDMNPFVNLYRRFTPHLRTPDEKPFDYRDLRVLAEGFSRAQFKELTLSALPVIGLSPALSKVGIGEVNLRPFYRLDEALFRVAPFMRRFCWNVVLSLTK